MLKDAMGLLCTRLWSRYTIVNWESEMKLNLNMSLLN
jgi:hypothetical protein